MGLAKWAAIGCLIGFVVLLFVMELRIERQEPKVPLTEVFTPSFRHYGLPHQTVTATLRHLGQDLATPEGDRLLQRVVPDQAGVLWLSLIVSLVIAFDFQHLGNPRNIDLLVMQAIGFCFFEVIRLLRVLHVPRYVHLIDWVFTAVFCLSLTLIVRAIVRIFRPARLGWRPALPARALAAIAILLLTCDVATALVRRPDDVGFWVNLGAQRLRERGTLPYGDPMLTRSPGASYGPLMYLADLPFQLILAPQKVNAESPDLPVLGEASTYYLPPQLADELCVIVFHLIGVTALVVAGRRLGGPATGWALAALYCGSAYVLGIGGDESEKMIGGMTYLSHIAPTSVTLCAFAALAWPTLAGVLLAAATGVGFYPAFMAPAWLGYYWDRGRDRWRFAAGFLVAAAAIGIFTLALSRPLPGHGRVHTILSDTFGHHTDPEYYGSSPFGFWGQRDDIRAWLMRPLPANSAFTTPVFVLFLGLTLAGFWVTRHTCPQQLALATAAVAIAATLVKIHSTGTYVAWSSPFLLLGFFGCGDAAEDDVPAA